MGYLAPKSLSHTLYHTYTHKHTHLHTHTNTNSSTHKHPHLQPLFLVVRFPQTFNLIEVHRTNEKKDEKKTKKKKRKYKRTRKEMGMIEASKALTGTSTKENCQKKKIKK